MKHFLGGRLSGILLSFLLASCGGLGGEQYAGIEDSLEDNAAAMDKDKVMLRIEAADRLRKQAAELEFEWRFTAKHLKEARAQLAEGKLDEANRLAERAEFEARSALEQSQKSSESWKLAVPPQ